MSTTTTAVLHPGPAVGVPLPVFGNDVPVTLTDGRTVAHANLDIAASAPCAEAALAAVTALLPSYANVHRGAGPLSQRCTRAYEAARSTIADFLGCRPDDQVVFTRHTTDALNLLAAATPAGTTVLTFAAEHHANLLPWARPQRLPVPASPAEAVAAVERALRDGRTGGPTLVAVSGASNVTGELWPVAEIAEVARRHGARVVVDAAQLAAHRPVSLTELGVDYVAISGHKLYAPFGIGVLAGRADWLDEAPPYLRGGGATDWVGDHGQVDWAITPARHEAGTPNLVGAVALAAVCAELTPVRLAALAAREGELLRRLRAGLATVPGLHQLGIFGPRHPRLGIVSFAVAGHDSAVVARKLAEEHGVGVRDGLFCAHPLTRHLLAGSSLPTWSPPATAVRASIGAGTTDEHIQRLLTGLRQIAGAP